MLQLIYILAHEGFSFDHSMMSRGTVLDATGYSKPFTKSFSARIDFCLFQNQQRTYLGFVSVYGAPHTYSYIRLVELYHKYSSFWGKTN